MHSYSPTHIEPSLDFLDRHIFITGGTGFLGKSILDHFLQLAQTGATAPVFHVSVLSRNPHIFLNANPRYRDIPGIEFVEGDIHRLPKLNRPVTDVIHGAADTHGVTDGLAWFHQLVNGTQSVLEFARRNSAQRFLFLSSGAVYGSASQPTLFRETHAFAPLPTDLTAIYAHGKRTAETLCAMYGADGHMASVIARCFTFISPYIPLNGGYAAGNFIRDALDAKVDHLLLTGHPHTTRSFMDGRDAASCLIKLLTHGKTGEAYNVGSDQVLTIQAIAQKVLEVLAPHKTLLLRSTEKTNQASHYTPNMEKTKAFGWQAKYTIEETLKFTANSLCNFTRDKG